MMLQGMNSMQSLASSQLDSSPLRVSLQLHSAALGSQRPTLHCRASSSTNLHSSTASVSIVSFSLVAVVVSLVELLTLGEVERLLTSGWSTVTCESFSSELTGKWLRSLSSLFDLWPFDLFSDLFLDFFAFLAFFLLFFSLLSDSFLLFLFHPWGGLLLLDRDLSVPRSLLLDRSRLLLLDRDRLLLSDRSRLLLLDLYRHLSLLLDLLRSWLLLRDLCDLRASLLRLLRCLSLLRDRFFSWLLLLDLCNLLLSLLLLLLLFLSGSPDHLCFLSGLQLYFLLDRLWLS